MPLWEYQSLLEEYYRIDAHNSLTQLHTIAAGFNGGESCQQLESALRRRIDGECRSAIRGNSDDYEDIDPHISIEELFGISFKI